MSSRVVFKLLSLISAQNIYARFEVRQMKTCLLRLWVVFVLGCVSERGYAHKLNEDIKEIIIESQASIKDSKENSILLALMTTTVGGFTAVPLIDLISRRNQLGPIRTTCAAGLAAAGTLATASFFIPTATMTYAYYKKLLDGGWLDLLRVRFNEAQKSGNGSLGDLGKAFVDTYSTDQIIFESFLRELHYFLAFLPNANRETIEGRVYKACKRMVDKLKIKYSTLPLPRGYKMINTKYCVDSTLKSLFH